MEFSIKQPVLKAELGLLMGVVERKNTMPILAHLLIESVGDSAVRITATDLDVTLRCEAAAAVETQGAICVPAQKLSDIARYSDGSDLHFKTDENGWVNLKAGRSKFRIAAAKPDQFPDIREPEGYPFELPSDVLGYLIPHTAFAITKDSSRFALSGAQFEISGSSVRMVATDGHRLALVDRSVETGGESNLTLLIPRKALGAVVRMIGDGPPTVRFGADLQNMRFESGTHVLVARRLTGNFPNYEVVIPKDNEHRAVFDWSAMKAAVRRISLMADERNRSMRMTIRPGEIELRAENREEGEGVEVITSDYNGPETLLGFQHQYLQEFLNVVATGTEVEPVEGEEKDPGLRIAFDFKNSNSPVQCTVAGETGYDYRYVLMPLRI